MSNFAAHALFPLALVAVLLAACGSPPSYREECGGWIEAVEIGIDTAELRQRVNWNIDPDTPFERWPEHAKRNYRRYVAAALEAQGKAASDLIRCQEWRAEVQRCRALGLAPPRECEDWARP